MKDSTQKKQLSRYYPKKGAFPKFVIRDRDREIMRLIYEHRFLNTNLIWHLLKTDNPENQDYKIGKDGKKRPTKYGFGEKALYKRLQQLFHGRYLERHLITDEPVGRGYGSPKAIYGLGLKSAPIIAEITGITSQEIRNIVLSNKIKSPFLRHAIEIATFRVTLELACQATDCRVRILFWEQGQRLQDSVFGKNEKNKEERFSVFPDAFFGIEVEDKGKAHYFLEVDRGTMPIIASKNRSDIRKKIFGYYYYRKLRKSASRYAYRTIPDGEVVGLAFLADDDSRDKKYNPGLEPIQGFRVLFLVPGRVEQDARPSGRMANILSAFPSFGRAFSNTSLFWFSNADAFDLEQPHSVFFRAWLTPGSGKQLQSLIE
jgi:hypothetical protein